MNVAVVMIVVPLSMQAGHCAPGRSRRTCPLQGPNLQAACPTAGRKNMIIRPASAKDASGPTQPNLRVARNDQSRERKRADPSYSNDKVRPTTCRCSPGAPGPLLGDASVKARWAKRALRRYSRTGPCCTTPRLAAPESRRASTASPRRAPPAWPLRQCIV